MNKPDIVNALLEALDRRQGAELVIVAGSEGSAPRGAGAWMAVFADGSMAGTVGGGALEGQAIEDARSLLIAGRSRLTRYTIGGPKSDTGMVCGGSVTLLFLHVSEGHRRALERTQGAFEACEEAEISVDLAPLGGPLPAGAHGADAAHTTDSALGVSVGRVFHADARKVDAASGAIIGRGSYAGIRDGRYVEPVCAEGRAYVIGCGHVGRALVEVLGFAGFTVIACDDRPDMLDPALTPRARERIPVDYGELALSLTVTPRDFVVVCTAGHRSDYEVLLQVLSRRPAYIGCLGSRKKSAHTRGRLLEAGCAAQDVEAICMPVGIPIACETPEEIALSVAAQMVDARHKGSASLA